MATRYVDPVPNASARNWGGAQGHAKGNKGTGTKNIGADYLANYGSPLYAPIGGNIVQVIRSKYTGTETDPNIRQQAVNENYGWGTSVIIQGDDGFYHRLSHMVPDSPTVKVGSRVDAGQQIGAVGQSGNTIGNGIAGGAPHLDWEKFKAPSGNFLGGDRTYVDPRLGDFDDSPQSYASKPATRYAGENDARGGLNRGAMSPAMQKWAGLIEEKADKYGLPPELLAGIVDYESGGDPNAGHPTSGATGLGQVMPKGSGQWFNDRPTKQELLDPETNLEWSAKILAANYKRYDNNPQSAAAAYLGAVDAKGNPTTAADANGTNGFKYIQEVMGRAEKFAPTGTSGPSASQNLAAQEQAQERAMANNVQEMIRDYNNNRTVIDKRVNEVEADAKTKQDAYNKALARQAELQALPKMTPDQEKEFNRLGTLSIPPLAEAAKAAQALAADARKDRENNDAALNKNLEIIQGKTLTEEEKGQYKANSENAQRQADLYKSQAALLQPGAPGYAEAQAKAQYAQAQADNYKRTIDLQERQIGQKDRELGQGDRRLGQDDRRIGLDEWEKGQTVPATVARTLAGAGLDEAQAANVWARIKPGIADLEADTRLKGDQAAYQKAMTERVLKLAGPEFDKLVGEGKLIQTQVDKALALLPSDIAKANQDVRQGQAQTGLLQGQTWAQMVQASTAQFEAEMKAREAETWQQVQKIASNPNSSDDDIIGAIQAGSRNATEAANVYQTRINQFQQQEAARHNKVSEGVAIQTADETERNNRYTNLAGIQNARANMQNASTSALSSSLGASRRANELSALGMVTGSAGLNRIAMQSGAGASVVNPAIEGLQGFEKDQATLRAGVRDNRLADPNAQGSQFKAPGATAATAGIGSAGIPKLNAMKAPEIEGVNFKAPGAAGMDNTIQTVAGATRPETNLTTSAMWTHSNSGEPPGEMGSPESYDQNSTSFGTGTEAAPPPELTELAPPPPPEEEEGTGGGKKPGGGVKVMFNFKPPKASKQSKAKKSTSVAADKPRKTKLGAGGGFRVPGRIAA